MKSRRTSDNNELFISFPNSGQTPGGSLIVMNDWIVGATNTVPATGALTMFAINQGDASMYYSVQPYLHDPVAPELAAVFSPAVSWADMSLEADPENGLFYGVETLARSEQVPYMTQGSAVQPGYFRNAKFDDKFDSNWKLDREAGVAMMSKPTDRLKNFKLKFRPMLGCVGVAPPSNQAFRSGWLGPIRT